VWLLAGDEGVVAKSGKDTHGLGVFFLDPQQAAPGPVLSEPIVAAGRDPRVLSFGHGAIGARGDPGQRAEGPKANNPKPGRPKGSASKTARTWNCRHSKPSCLTGRFSSENSGGLLVHRGGGIIDESILG